MEETRLAGGRATGSSSAHRPSGAFGGPQRPRCCISLSTARIVQRSQVHQNYLSQWASPFHEPYQALIATYEQTLRAMGRAGAAVHDVAVGRVYQMFRIQAAVLAYSDVFFYCAMVAFMLVPFCFLLSSKTGGGQPGGAH